MRMCECGCGQALTAPAYKKRRFAHGHNGRRRPLVHMAPKVNPSDTCMCGCGEKTKMVQCSVAERGLVKGTYRQFRPGHNRALKPCATDKIGPNPSGLCMCGCGERVGLAKLTNNKLGFVVGQPVMFVAGHSSRKDDQSYLGAYRRVDDEYAHILIAERALGHALPKRAQVHHVDGNGLNNANSNLVICQDAAYHQLLHRRQRIRDHGGNPNTDMYCSTCDRCKPVECFSVLNRNSSGRATKCKACLTKRRSLDVAC